LHFVDIFTAGAKAIVVKMLAWSKAVTPNCTRTHILYHYAFAEEKNSMIKQ
jgi:hypothetical protein